MIEDRYYGLNLKGIPKDVIPYKEQCLLDMDTIENERGDILIWKERAREYFILTNDPTKYLNASRIYSPWKKR